MDTTISRDLRDTVAVVTGGAGGIGRAIAALFVQEGAAVVVADRDTDRGREIADEVAAIGPCEFVETDVANPASIDRLAEAVEGRFGPADVLVNNAAIVSFAPFRDTTLAEYSRIMDVNLRSVFLVSQAFIPQMEARGQGSIVNVASTGGHFVALKDLSAYCAAKAGVIGLTRVMAMELAEIGIRVNAVCPGAVHTPMLEQGFEKYPDLTLDFYAQSNVLKRVGKPSEIAQAVLFAAATSGAYMTGSPLVVDGGQMIV